MKQLFLMVDSGAVSLIDTPAPVIKENTVLVETLYSAVSAGTERALVSFGKKNLFQKVLERPDQLRKVLEKIDTDGLVMAFEAAFNKLSEPMPIGYSAVGRVMEAGKGITDIKAGDFVAIAGQAYHAEVNRVNRNLLVKLPIEFADIRQAAFVALGGIAMQGLRQAKVENGESVAVIGLGLLGHILAQILYAYGCDIIAFDINEEEKPEYIKSFIHSNDPHAGDVVRSFTGGRGVDKVIITASTDSNQPMDLAADIIRDRGTICMVGVTQMEIDRRPYYQKELTFTIARSYGPGRYDPAYEEKGVDYPIGQVRWTEQRNMAEFIRLIHSGRIDLSPLITHEIEFSMASKAYDIITNPTRKEKYKGILLKYSAYPEKASSKVMFSGGSKAAIPGQIGTGIIGAGLFTRSTLLPNLQKAGDFRLVGMATTGGVNAAQAQSATPFQYVTSNYAELLSDPNVSLVIVSTQHDSHAKITAEALRAGKHVYVEKPLALTQDELLHVKDAFDGSEGCLFVGFNRRHSPLVDMIKKRLRTADNACVFQYTVNAGYIPDNHWTQDEKSGGGRIIGEACHFIDTLQYLAGSSLIDLTLTRMDDQSGIYPKADNCFITLKFKNGSIGSILYSAMGGKRYPKEKLLVFHNGQIAELNNYISVNWYAGGRKTTYRLKQDKGFLAEYKYIAKVIHGDTDARYEPDIWDNHGRLIRALDNDKK